MTQMKLEELEKLAESGFSKGEWKAEFEVDGNGFEQNQLWILMGNNVMAYDFDRAQDAKLAAAAPSLLTELIAAKKREKELVEALDKLINGGKDGYFSAENIFVETSDLEKARALLKDIEQ